MAQMSQEDAEKKILEFQSVELSPQAQDKLNKPLSLEGGLEQKDRDFLTMIEDKISKGEIQLFKPGTLLNTPVYENLDEPSQAKAELDAYNMLSTIREMHKLWTAGHQESYQLSNLVHKIRITKERLEEIGGDIYII
jgi:hypothetical protein